MFRYIIRRVLWLIPVLLFISLITFTLMKVTPGGPWDKEKQVAPAALANLNRKYNLDKPGYEQYFLYMGNALRGDLGPSYIYQDRSVTEILRRSIGPTATLGALAVLAAVLVGVPLGIIAALRQNTIVDYVALGFASLGASVPNFVLSYMLIFTLAVGLKLAPTGGWGKPNQLILPVLVLAVLPTAVLARITRASVLEVLRQDYMRTARAKGLAAFTITQRHLLKNALIPVATVLGPVLAALITGSFIVESIFSIPGVGRLLIQGVSQRDYSLIMGTVLLYALVIAVLNLVVDVLYVFIDPRIKYT